MNGPGLRRRIGWLALAWLLAGCQSSAPPPKGYFGPTLSIDKLIEAVNRNNSQLPTLWAHHDFEATVVDAKAHKSRFVNGYGTLLYQDPASLRLVAKKEVTDLFDMGSDGTHYWLRLVPDQDTFWWGSFSDLDNAATEQIPIRPDLIIEVLGVRPISTSLMQAPVPVLRFNHDADAYMLVWQVPRGGHWAAQKEIWYDRATLHPTLILLFDPDGRVLLRAWLSDFKPVRIADVPEDQWPTVATHYRLFFPQTGTKMSFSLSDVSRSHGGFPKAISFRMPDLAKLADSGVKVIHIDETSGS